MSTFTQLEKISKFIHSKPILKKIFLPASRVFTHLGGYHKMGLKTEDLFMEENDVMQIALRRLPAEQSYMRAYRIATAFQLSLTQQILPKKQWLRPEDDTSYLVEHLLQAEAELNERDELDNLTVSPKKLY